MDAETGYGKAWHCDYYHTLQNRIEKYGREVDRCRAAVRDVEEKMRKDLKVGDPVVALRNILEGGGSPGNPNAVFPDPQYIHGAKGDRGEVIHIDQRGYPTVRFERTGTATIVDLNEIDKIMEGTK